MHQLLNLFKRTLRASMLVLTVVFVAFGQAHAADPTPEQMYAEIISAWNARDANKLAGLYAASGSVFTSPNAGENADPARFKAYLQAFFTAVPDFKLEMKQSAPISPNYLVDEWVVSGTWSHAFPGGPLVGVPATGKKFVLNGSSFHQLKDGKLVSTVQYYDNMSFLTQIGAIPSGR